MVVDKNNYFIQDWMSQMRQTVKLTYPTLTDKEIDDYLEKIIDDIKMINSYAVPPELSKKNICSNCRHAIQWGQR